MCHMACVGEETCSSIIVTSKLYQSERNLWAAKSFKILENEIGGFHMSQK